MDLWIRNGTLVDGTGAAPRPADVGIENGRIRAISEPETRARRAARDEIDATGCIVTPGFVDPHTHYDGQVTWDDALEPMGYLLRRDLPNAEIVALDIVYSGGSAWNCTGSASDDCGVHSVRGPRSQTEGITLFGPGSAAFSGRCSIGQASPSEPAFMPTSP